MRHGGARDGGGGGREGGARGTPRESKVGGPIGEVGEDGARVARLEPRVHPTLDLAQRRVGRHVRLQRAVDDAVHEQRERLGVHAERDDGGGEAAGAGALDAARGVQQQQGRHRREQRGEERLPDTEEGRGARHGEHQDRAERARPAGAPEGADDAREVALGALVARRRRGQVLARGGRKLFRQGVPHERYVHLTAAAAPRGGLAGVRIDGGDVRPPLGKDKVETVVVGNVEAAAAQLGLGAQDEDRVRRQKVQHDGRTHLVRERQVEGQGDPAGQGDADWQVGIHRELNGRLRPRPRELRRQALRPRSDGRVNDEARREPRVEIHVVGLVEVGKTHGLEAADQQREVEYGACARACDCRRRDSRRHADGFEVEHDDDAKAAGAERARRAEGGGGDACHAQPR